jgi:tetratricopeptide (TPR) repeat protein
MEQMSDLIDIGYDAISENDSITACNLWLKVWEAIKVRCNSEFNNLKTFNNQYDKCFFVSNICQDLEFELYNAGIKDKSYFKKRIDYCREFLECFPNEDELIIYNMRRAIAKSYLHLNNYEQAELEYISILQDYPDNCWGYIGWGDMYLYGEKKDYVKAKELYGKGLAIVGDEADRNAIQERLMDLEQNVKKGGKRC